MRNRTGRPPGYTPKGPEIKRIRLDRGLTAAQVAALMGPHHHPESISATERGRPISDVFAHRLARALGVKVEDIASPPPKALASLDTKKAPAADTTGAERERKPAPSITTSKGENPE